jgi:hypothetical protein
VETAGRHDAPDGRLSHDDLVAAGEFFNGQPLNVQNATNHILGTPGLEANLDSAAHGGPPDNNISRNDLRHHLAREIFVVFNVEEILAEIDNQLDQNAENFVRGHCG